jgi:hypothetical protein
MRVSKKVNILYLKPGFHFVETVVNKIPFDLPPPQYLWRRPARGKCGSRGKGGADVGYENLLKGFI